MNQDLPSNRLPIISLSGLTDQQAWLAAQLWTCDDLDEIADLKDSIQDDMLPDLYLVMECIYMAHVDQYVETEEDCATVSAILRRIQDESYA